jgi:hypothetical protein
VQLADENLFYARNGISCRLLAVFTVLLFTNLSKFQLISLRTELVCLKTQLADSTVSRKLLGFIRSTVVFDAFASDVVRLSGFECVCREKQHNDVTGFPSGWIYVSVID